MITTSCFFIPTDTRRAVDLLCRYQERDAAGVMNVLREAVRRRRVGNLTVAMCGLFFQLHPELMTAEGRESLQEFARSCAAASRVAEGDNEEWG